MEEVEVKSKSEVPPIGQTPRRPRKRANKQKNNSQIANNVWQPINSTFAAQNTAPAPTQPKKNQEYQHPLSHQQLKELVKADRAKSDYDVKSGNRKHKDIPPSTQLPIRNASPPSGPKQSAHSRRDTIIPPSAASGGVPEPSRVYLDQSLHVSNAQPTIQAMLVVIDLNGTLLFRPNRKEPTKFTGRPFAANFLLYVLSNFHVMIWSSARPENVNNMTNNICTPAQRQQLVAVWGRDRMGLSPQDYNMRVQCYKRLEQVWNDYGISRTHPHNISGRAWNQTNTILIDDSFEKARSEPFNLITVPEFNGQTEDPNILRKVAEYLDLVKYHNNVSAFMRSRPFRLVDSHI